MLCCLDAVCTPNCLVGGWSRRASTALPSSTRSCAAPTGSCLGGWGTMATAASGCARWRGLGAGGRGTRVWCTAWAATDRWTLRLPCSRWAEWPGCAAGRAGLRPICRRCWACQRLAQPLAKTAATVRGSSRQRQVADTLPVAAGCRRGARCTHSIATRTVRASTRAATSSITCGQCGLPRGGDGSGQPPASLSVLHSAPGLLRAVVLRAHSHASPRLRCSLGNTNGVRDEQKRFVRLDAAMAMNGHPRVDVLKVGNLALAAGAGAGRCGRWMRARVQGCGVFSLPAWPGLSGPARGLACCTWQASGAHLRCRHGWLCVPADGHRGLRIRGAVRWDQVAITWG